MFTFISIIVIYESMQRLAFIEEYVYKKIINDDINSGNERDEIYNSFKDPKFSGTTLKTEDG